VATGGPVHTALAALQRTSAQPSRFADRARRAAFPLKTPRRSFTETVSQQRTSLPHKATAAGSIASRGQYGLTMRSAIGSSGSRESSCTEWKNLLRWTKAGVQSEAEASTSTLKLEAFGYSEMSVPTHQRIHGMFPGLSRLQSSVGQVPIYSALKTNHSSELSGAGPNLICTQNQP
jgi:hypothetical protein